MCQFRPLANVFVREVLSPTLKDPFTLQYTAEHDNIKTTMRYVLPRAHAVHMKKAVETMFPASCLE
jgi:hypothetical protein